MTTEQHDRYGYCDECDPYGDSSICICVHPPLEDFENGYSTELTTDLRPWFERANANPLNTTLFLRTKYSGPSDRVECIAMRENPMMMVMQHGERFVASFEQGMKRAIENQWQVKYVDPVELVGMYPSGEFSKPIVVRHVVQGPNRFERRRERSIKRKKQWPQTSW